MWCNHEWWSLKRRGKRPVGERGRGAAAATRFRVQQGGEESWKTLEEVFGPELAADVAAFAAAASAPGASQSSTNLVTTDMRR